MKHLFSKTALTLCTIAIVMAGIVFVSFHRSAKAECTATGTSQYCLLEPLPLGDGQVYDKYDPSGTSAAGYINIVIKVFISVIGALGVIMIVLGGVQYMTTDAVSKKEGGKEMITNSVFGLLLALCSWILLNEINPQLLEIHIDPPTTKVTLGADGAPAPGQVTVDGQTFTTICTQSPTIEGKKIIAGADWGTTKDSIGYDKPVRDWATKTLKLGINAANCPTVGASGCTSLAGYKLSVLVNATSFRDKICKGVAGCNLQITGGTECWKHSTHGPGLDPMDFGPAPIDAYIKANNVPKTCIDWIKDVASDGCPTGQAGKYAIGSVGLVRESDHYHVSSW